MTALKIVQMFFKQNILWKFFSLAERFVSGYALPITPIAGTLRRSRFYSRGSVTDRVFPVMGI